MVLRDLRDLRVQQVRQVRYRLPLVLLDLRVPQDQLDLRVCADHLVSKVLLDLLVLQEQRVPRALLDPQGQPAPLRVRRVPLVDQRVPQVLQVLRVDLRVQQVLQVLQAHSRVPQVLLDLQAQQARLLDQLDLQAQPLPSLVLQVLRVLKDNLDPKAHKVFKEIRDKRDLRVRLGQRELLGLLDQQVQLEQLAQRQLLLVLQDPLD